ncbi:putative pyridine nucleotide-disulfide oxidoreductase [Macrophomina phaseolina]|uniref:Pyridine nucleotide-disulfide oxidoreductase n=1 Tax=Macrophomina phaseolina TaxID=35725 RepID=A0ABQ8G8C1_9PEZI|nr:putative pyridine nucleotide-disulfide oxidoreductase [Macrophomina phaseolina]
MVPGYDHQSLLTYISDIRRDLTTRYNTNTFVNAKATEILKLTEGEHAGFFQITDANGQKWLGRKVVLAIGNVERFPDVPGYEDCWIKGIFHCQVHRGFEVAGCKMAGVLAVEGDASLFKARHLALEAKAIAQRVTIFTHGNEELATEVRETLKDWPEGLYTIDTRRIKRLVKGPEASDVDIHFEQAGSSPTTVNYIIHRPIPEIPGSFVQQLGLEIDNSGIINPGFIKVGGIFNETNVPGVFAVGDCASAFKVVPSGVNMGSFTAAGLAAQLAGETPSRHGFACVS